MSSGDGGGRGEKGVYVYLIQRVSIATCILCIVNYVNHYCEAL